MMGCPARSQQAGILVTAQSGAPLPAAALRGPRPAARRLAYPCPTATPAPTATAVVSAPSEWTFSDETCWYARAFIEAIPTDSPLGGRHHWMLGKAVRLACAVPVRLCHRG